MTADSFDYGSGNPNEMYEFDMDDLENIFDVAIEKVLPSKTKFIPIGANVIFFCSRYAVYEKSNDIANECLLTGVYKIGSWVAKNDDLDTYSYWLTNCYQLLVYIKQDMKLLTATLEAQQRLNELIGTIFRSVVKFVASKVDKLAVNAFLHRDMDVAFGRVQMEPDYMGFGGRKSMLTSEASSYSSIVTSFFQTQVVGVDHATPLQVTIVFTDLLESLKKRTLHPVLIEQIFQKILEWLNSYLFDQLLANKTYCSRVAAKQILLNTSVLKDWINDSRYLKTISPDVQKFHDKLNSLTQLCQYLEGISSENQWDFEQNQLKEFPELNFSIIHHATCLYRYETPEPSIDARVQQLIQDRFNHEKESKGVEIFKGDKYEIGEPKIPINNDGSSVWTSIPFISPRVIEVWVG
jgi:hypothetical protein